jgi:IclR family acetate operon transcriptional repressor
LLAGRSDEFLHPYIAEMALPGMTDRSITTSAAFWAEIAAIRRQGYSVDNEEDSSGVHCLGTTLPMVHGPAVLAISITGPSPRFLYPGSGRSLCADPTGPGQTRGGAV